MTRNDGGENSEANREDTHESPLAGGGRTSVSRKGDVVIRGAGAWTPSVHALLRHLENVGFSAAPKVIGNGFDARGRETISYIDGDFVHPHAWPDEGLIAVARLLRALHDATEQFKPPENAVWRSWCGRGLKASDRRVYGHCDLGPWNIVARQEHPVGFIDWETAGPVDPLVEFAQACWLNVQLHDDDIAQRQGLPSATDRARQMRLMADSYGLSAGNRALLVDTMITYAVHDAADQAIQVPVTPDTTDASPLWGLAWRTRAAGWMLRHRPLLNRALA